MVRRETDFASRGSEPSILGDHVNGVRHTRNGVRNRNSRTRVVLVRQPIEHSFDADDGGSELIVGPYLTATGKNSIVRGKSEPGAKGVRNGATVPCGAEVATDIDAAPGERWSDRHVSRGGAWAGQALEGQPRKPALKAAQSPKQK
jgi:hypothetical protein